MAWQETPYTIPLIVAVVVSAISGLYIWWRHQAEAARTLALILLAGAGWILAYSLELVSIDFSLKILWSKMQYLPVLIAAVSWLIFTLQYTGREKWVTRRNLVLLSIIPVITMLLVFTNDYHELMWTNAELRTEDSLLLLETVPGPWFWIHSSFTYSLVLVSAALLIQVLVHAQRLYRWQIMSLLLASFSPVFLSVLELCGLYPYPYILTIGLLVPTASVAVALNIFRFRPEDIVPVARGTVIESMSDGVMVLDSQNRFVDANPLIQQLTGYPLPFLIGQCIDDVWPAWTDQMQSRQSGEEITIGEEDGQHTYDVRTSPLTDWHGSIISKVVVLRDITDRKRAEQLLHESEEKFRTIFENANDEIVYVDKHGTIVDTNEKAEEIFGYKREELVGKKFVELGFLGMENISNFVKLFMDAMKGGNPMPLALLEIKHKNGSTLYAEVSNRIIKRDGEVEGILSIVRDITERKKAEEEIKAALKEKEILLREIHHRVKNNLQIISSLLSLQSQYIKDDRHVEILKDSQNRVKSMALIHEKLYLSENLANIDFKEYIESLVRELVRSYKVDPGRITVNVDAENISLGVDTAIPCGLIINELVTNALKHAFPDGKGVITVALHTNNGAIELRVSDNGVGMPEDIDFRTTETLGLRLVSILAEDQLDGDITLTRDTGTEFCITFKE